eukprot:363316-Chlamydomonas_euryale.AAC.13
MDAWPDLKTRPKCAGYNTTLVDSTSDNAFRKLQSPLPIGPTPSRILAWLATAYKLQLVCEQPAAQAAATSTN